MLISSSFSSQSPHSPSLSAVMRRYILSSASLCLLFIITLTLLPTLTIAFYLPGVAPKSYSQGNPIGVKVTKLDSVKTQLPYDYYSLPFCPPPTIEEDGENLGEALSGERTENSLYKVLMRIEESCQILCRREYTNEQLAQFAEKIDEEYRVNWLLDNLPAATKYYTAMPGDNANVTIHYEKGFALGFTGHADIQNSESGVKYLNNHLKLIVFYHEHEDESTPEQKSKSRIVGFEVEAYSVAHKMQAGAQWVEPTPDQFTNEAGYLREINNQNKLATCSPTSGEKILPQRVSNFHESATSQDRTVIFTYDVTWKHSDIKWASRWDLYLKMTDSNIHWFSIINSLMIVLFLSGMVAVIMLRILHRDLSRYNNDQVTDEEEQKEETGWKLVHADVFRPPQRGNWLAVLVGTGVQILAMTFLTLIFATLGFLSPAFRGGLMTTLLFLFVAMGMLAGYYSTRTFKMFHLTETTSWKKNTLITALFFPGLVFSVFFILNLFLWHYSSSGAVPFDKLIALLVLWFGISVPLVYLGSYLAFRQPNVEHPVKVNNLARLLPPESQQAWYSSPSLMILLGGILPFAATFIEIFYIMSSVWLNQYYVFGFLFLVFLILIITCAEITIVLTYFQLCSEDYHWWWRSFLTPGSSALYLYLYSVLYFFTRLQMVKLVSALLFFGYMFLVSVGFFILTGTIGYLSTFMFVTKIYSVLKID